MTQLEIKASQLSKNFLETEKQYRLGFVEAEMSNPKTRLLGESFVEDTFKGIDISEISPKYNQLSGRIQRVITVVIDNVSINVKTIRRIGFFLGEYPSFFFIASSDFDFSFVKTIHP